MMLVVRKVNAIIAEIALYSFDLKRQQSRAQVEALLDAKLAMAREILLEEVEKIYEQFVPLPPREAFL